MILLCVLERIVHAHQWIKYFQDDSTTLVGVFYEVGHVGEALLAYPMWGNTSLFFFMVERVVKLHLSFFAISTLPSIALQP